MKIIKDWSPVVALVAIFLLLMNLRGCDPKKTVPATIPEIAKHTQVRTIIKWKTKVQTNEVIKWKVFKEKQLKDTTNPCNTEIRFVIQKADTVIKADSSLIASQRELIKLDSVIIFKQSIMLKADSIHIVKLDKKVKRSRRMALFFGAIVAGGVGVRVLN